MSDHACVRCESETPVYCGPCMDAVRVKLERLRRLAPSGTYTLNVQYEEKIQRLKDAGEVLVRSLERMTRERDEAKAALQRVVEYDRDPSASWNDLMSWVQGALLSREEREARCKYLVKP